MFYECEDNITSRLQDINLKETNMQPKAERPPVSPKSQLPQLHLTPSGGGQKRSDSISSPPGATSPWLLKPQHEIPATPPPNTRSQSEFFPQKTG